MESVTYTELCKIVKDNDFKKVALYNTNGKKLVAYNANNVPAVEKLKEIERKLKEKGTPDGYYIVHCRNSFHHSIEPSRYAILKGEKKAGMSEPAAMIIEPAGKQAMSDHHVLSWDEALKSHKELQELKIKVEQYEEKIRRLEKEVEELEEELEEVEQTMGEGNTVQNFMQDTIASLSPAFDSFMDVRKAQVRAQQQQMYLQMVLSGLAPPTPEMMAYLQQQQQPYMQSQNGQGYYAPPVQQPVPQNGQPAQAQPAQQFAIDEPPAYNDPSFYDWCLWASENYPEEYAQIMRAS